MRPSLAFPPEEFCLSVGQAKPQSRGPWRTSRVVVPAPPVPSRRLGRHPGCSSGVVSTHPVALARVRADLLRHPDRARHGVGRWVVQIGQNNPRPLDTTRGLGPRPRNLQQTLSLPCITRQCDHSTRCNHWTPQSNPLSSSYHISPKVKNQTQPIDILESLH
jgi:hypothetical protein